MQIKKLIFLIALALPIAVLAFAIQGQGQQTEPSVTVAPGFVDDFIIWQLDNIEVIDQGETVILDEGRFTKDVVIVANASASSGQMLPDGVFQMTFSAFTPVAEMGKQKPGYWYVQGGWTITKTNADPEAMTTKHNAEQLQGDILAEVPFDPIAQLSNWTALARLTMTLVGGNWADGEGTLTLNRDNTGSLFLDLTAMPDMRAEVTQ
ncbi:MAG: hypothetical protein WAS33_27915 [Candidatus Promineifilaceae bacterium]